MLRVLVLFLWVVGILQAEAGSNRVLIILGLSGDQEEADRFQGIGTRLQAAFVQRGIPNSQVEVLPEATRDGILSHLSQVSGSLHKEDELWLVLLGHGSVEEDDPVFQVRGKRLRAMDLKDALSSVLAKQIVVITTENSGGYIPVLNAPNRIIFTATEAAGEVNDTVFPEAFTQALEDLNNQSFLKLAQGTAALVSKHYQDQNLVQTEHSLLSDPSHPDDPWKAPFDGTSSETLANLALGSQKAPPVVAEDEPMENMTPAPSKVVEGAVHAATPETLAIMKAAGSIVDRREPAIILNKAVNFLVNSDQKVVMTTHQTVLVNKPSLSQWTDLNFTSISPMQKTTVLTARTIFPDGTYQDAHTFSHVDMLADYLPEEHVSLRLPGVKPGCVLETNIQFEDNPSSEVDAVYQELPITESAPILNCELTLRLPKDDSVKFLLRNLVGTAQQQDTTYSHVYDWKWKNLPAVEHMPLDPPLEDVEGEVLLSSFKTWDEFGAWNDRISAGCHEASPLVKACAERVTKGLTTDSDKLKALFEEVSQIHYAAIEIGVGGFRPHTPEWVLQNNFGDCKDKANLLITLAKQVGIYGQFVLLNRTSQTDTTFPGFQFNHAISYFPSVNGGIWLDATDEITRFGQLPPGDVGRNVLIMVDKPIFRTIPTPPAQATRLTEHLSFDSTGKSLGKWTLDTQGLTDYGLRGSMRSRNGLEANELLRRMLNILVPGATLEGYSTSDLEDLEKPVHLEATFDCLPGFEPYMISHIPMDLLDSISTPNRTLPLVLNDGQPFLIEQHVEISSLTDSAPLPAAFSDQTADARVTVSFSRDAGVLRRDLVINVENPVIAPSNYPAFRRLIQQTCLALVKRP